jgi:argininosuccinate synthase
MKGEVKKVVLAYSGGLDTSVILKWLQVEYACEVVTFTADLGQGEELGPARDKAVLMGIPDHHIYIDDLREEFVRDFVFPMMRANARYEGDYLLGTSIARPLISKRLIEIAAETGADAIAHGATGKGNDQVRFELSAYALNPDIKVDQPHAPDRMGGSAPDSRAEGQARGIALFDRREPAAHFVRREGARGPVGRDPGLCLFAHGQSGGCTRQP